MLVKQDKKERRNILLLRKCAADRVCRRKMKRLREGGCVSDLQEDFTPGLYALMQWANHTAIKPLHFGVVCLMQPPPPPKRKRAFTSREGDSEANTR